MWPMNVSAVYWPPKHVIKKHDFLSYFHTLGNRFICGYDINAKHMRWGSRIITPKGRELSKTLDALGLDVVTTGVPTYWPTDRRNIPDLIDAFISKGINNTCFLPSTSFDLLLDHTSAILILSRQVMEVEMVCVVSNKQKNWAFYRRKI